MSDDNGSEAAWRGLVDGSVIAALDDVFSDNYGIMRRLDRILMDAFISDGGNNPVQKSYSNKLAWQGRIISAQPRIRLTRSFDQRYHTYLGYSLIISGLVDNEEREFSIGIGKAALAKHEFRVGDTVSGQSEPVMDERIEPVEF